MNYWMPSKLGNNSAGQMVGTYRFESDQLTIVGGEDVNTISNYVYQMIIRETDSRNTMARLGGGIIGGAAAGPLGIAASEATSWLLRSSGFMRGNDGWDGQNWEEAGGANFDPLLMYAWGRTDFQTGNWWSTVDSQGDVGFWMDVMAGGHGGTNEIVTKKFNPDYKDGVWSYEQIIYFAHQEIQNNEWGPFLLWLAQEPSWGEFPMVMEASQPTDLPGLTEEEEEAIREQGRREQEENDPDDDRMPGDEKDPDEDDPTKAAYWRSRNEQPPPGWQPS
jgi:hypothetical protein